MRRANCPRTGIDPNTEHAGKLAHEIPTGSGRNITTDQFQAGEALHLRTQTGTESLIVQGLWTELLAIKTEFPWTAMTDPARCRCRV